MKRAVAIAAIVLGALLALLLAAWLWLFHSHSGRDAALGRLRDTLGAEQWSVAAAEGTLAGPLTLHDVEYRLADGTRIRIGRLLIDYGPGGLLRRRIDIDALEAEQIVIERGDAAEPVEPTPWTIPERLPWPSIRLPVSLVLRDVRLRDITIIQPDAAPIALAMVDAALQWPRGGPLTIERLQAGGAAGELQAAGSVWFDGTPAAELQASLRPAEAPEPLRLTAHTVGERLQLGLTVPGSGEATIALAQPFDYRIDIALDAFVPSKWLGGADPAADPPLPFDLHLQAHGDGRQAMLEGEFERDGQRIVIAPSTFRLDRGSRTVHLDPLELHVGGDGRILVAGTIALDGPLLDLHAELHGLQWPLADGPPASLGGTLRLAGPLDALAITLDGELARADLRADLAVQAELQPDRLQIERLQLQQQAGRLTGHGTVGWQPGPNWRIDAELHEFDPGVIAESLAGRIDGALAASGRIDEHGRLALDLRVDDLHGRLRERPLQVSGHIALQPDGRGSARLSARFGDSRIRIDGDPGPQRDLQIRLAPLHLADLLADAEGTLRGTLRLRGSGAAARIAGTLHGEDLLLERQRIGRLDVDVDAALDLQADSELQLQLADAELQGESIDQLEFDVRGGLSGMQAELDLSGPRLALSGRWRGRRDGEQWIGSVHDLQMSAPDVPKLTLERPAEIRIGPDGIEVGANCLTTPDGRACFSLQQRGAQQKITFELDDLPLGLLDPWLAFDDARMRLDGRINGNADITLVDGALQRGTLELRSTDGALHWLREPVQQIIEWGGLRVDGSLVDGRLQFAAQAAIDDTGRLDLQLAGTSPLADPASPSLSGRLELQLPQIRLLSLMPETIVAPRGRLDAELQIGGAWQAPELAGTVELREFSAEIPALGIQLADTSLSLRGDRQQLRIDGVAHSAGQPLQISGTVESPLASPQAAFDIRGEQVVLVDTPLVRAVASPDVQARYDGALLQLRGRIGLPSARLALERIELTEPASDDVVVLDPRAAREQDTPLPIDADLRVVLGDDVEIEGFGFDGGLSGTLRIRERPGKPTTARGSLAVRGEYTAYGQDLAIDRGRLVYSNTPIDDPALDLRVAREVRGQRVGLDIRGSARDPSLTVWSEGDTTLDQGEALSLLLFGRPLSTAGDADSEQLTQAALAVGGNLLAARLGARLGFDTFELVNSDSLGGTAFTVGKYLSPRLHIAYGVSLFGAGQVLSLSYMISEQFEFELETGEESRGSLNYRIER